MKNYFPTITKAWNAIKRLVQNRFEAATQSWGVRRWLWSAYQDARFEVDFAASMEICRKHLDLVQNVPLIQKIRNLKIQFAVGVDGLMVVPNASDPTMDKKFIEEWNETRAQRWEEWAKAPELGSNLSLAELTVQWEGMLFDVGNVIVHKTYDENGKPKVQTIDRLRLQTPPDLKEEEGKSICGGIRLKKITVPCVRVVDGKRVKSSREIITGKPESYFIRDEFDQTAFCEIPAKDIIHKFRALRPGMLVGIPEAFSVINTIIDYTDLHILEMQAAKLAAEIANVETNATGEVDTLAARRVRLNIQSQNAAGTAVTKNADEFYQVSFGGKNLAVKHGDKLENFMVHRPTIAQQQYWELKQSEICIGYNVPKLLVFPYSIQGTVARGELAVSSDGFRADFEIIASIVREIYEWKTQWDVKYDKGMDGKTPENFLACTIRPPKAPDVDVGYTAEALALELEMGTKTFQDVCAANNKDWRNVMREKAEAEAYKNSLAEEFSIEPNAISCTQFKSIKNQPQEEKDEKKLAEK